MLTAVILAAGESSRMGSPKALVPFHGQTFLEHLLGVARTQTKPEISGIRVVLGSHAGEISSALGLTPEIVVLNPDWERGQLSSIQAAIRSIDAAGSAKTRHPDAADSTRAARHTEPDKTDGIILFLVDHPLISASLVERLVAEFYRSGQPIVVPTFRGRRGHPVIFAGRLYQELLDAPAEQGARAVVWAHAAEVLEVPTDEEGVLLNLNDPDTLRRALG
jgi:molybdenum cofactor cytidylyltransferase